MMFLQILCYTKKKVSDDVELAVGLNFIDVLKGELFQLIVNRLSII